MVTRRKIVFSEKYTRIGHLAHTMDHINTLPSDALIAIIEHVLDRKSLFACTLVCRRWKEVVHYTRAWQFLVWHPRTLYGHSLQLALMEENMAMVPHYAAREGQAGLLQWLHDTLILENTRTKSVKGRALDLLYQACQQSSPECAQWITTTFPGVDVRAAENYAFQIACEHGGLAMAQWLYETFHLTRQDACACKNYAFRWACKNGKLDVAQWLYETFQLTSADMHAHFDDALYGANANGRVFVVEWLHELAKAGAIDGWDSPTTRREKYHQWKLECMCNMRGK